jgi:ketosteroid isomerase-like protein
MDADNKPVADDVESIVATFRLLDSDTYEDAIELVDEEFEMVTTPDLASEPDTYTGPEGVRRWWESFLDVMEWVRLEVQEVHPVDEHRAILEFQIHTRGRASGIETDQRAVGLATARDGKLYRLAFFTELEPARAAPGRTPR